MAPMTRAWRAEIRGRAAFCKFSNNKTYKPLRNGTHDKKQCFMCGTEADTMKRCAGCRWARYCSEACQKEHWKSHKIACDPDSGIAPGGISYELTSQAAGSQPGGSQSAGSQPGGSQPTVPSQAAPSQVAPSGSVAAGPTKPTDTKSVITGLRAAEADVAEAPQGR